MLIFKALGHCSTDNSNPQLEHAVTYMTVKSATHFPSVGCSLVSTIIMFNLSELSHSTLILVELRVRQYVVLTANNLTTELQELPVRCDAYPDSKDWPWAVCWSRSCSKQDKTWNTTSLVDTLYTSLNQKESSLQISSVINPLDQREFHDPLLIRGSPSAYIIKYEAGKVDESHFQRVLTAIAGTRSEPCKIPVYVLSKKFPILNKFQNLEVHFAENEVRLKQHISKPHDGEDPVSVDHKNHCIWLQLLSELKKKDFFLSSKLLSVESIPDVRSVLKIFHNMGVICCNATDSESDGDDHLIIDPLYLYNLLSHTSAIAESESGLLLSDFLENPAYSSLMPNEKPLGQLLVHLDLAAVFDDDEFTFLHTLSTESQDESSHILCSAGPLCVGKLDKDKKPWLPQKLFWKLVVNFSKSHVNEFERSSPSYSRFCFDCKSIPGTSVYVCRKEYYIEISYVKAKPGLKDPAVKSKWPEEIRKICQRIHVWIKEQFRDVILGFPCVHDSKCMQEFRESSDSFGLKCPHGFSGDIPWGKRIWFHEPSDKVQVCYV